MKRCSYELAPYTGTGVDPPTCAFAAETEVHGSPYCSVHAKQVTSSIVEAASDLERAACAAADAWMKEREFSLTRRMLDESVEALDALERATSSNLLRKVKS